MKRKRSTQSSDPEKLLKVFKDKFHLTNVKAVTKTVTTTLQNTWTSSKENLDRVNDAVQWISKLKARGTLFANWLVLHLLNNNHNLPLLKETFFTQVFATITHQSRETLFSREYEEYQRVTGEAPMAWMSNMSQILCHTKNEMVTVATTKLVNGFYNHRITLIRWKIVDGIYDYLLSLNLADRKKLLYKVSNRVVTGSTTWTGLNLPQHVTTFLNNLVVDDQQRLNSMDNEIRQRILAPTTTYWVKKLETDHETALVVATELINEMDRSILISKDPMSTLKYMYSHFQDLFNLPLTHRWYQMQLIRDKKERKEFWPWWRKVRFPRFSPLPFNRVSRQFIRIDQKTLKEWHVEPAPDKWWISTLLNIYKRERLGRLHPLAEWRFLDSPESTLQHFEVDDQLRPYHRPKLPGASFSTDGVSVHITMVTLESPHENVDAIFKRGYTGIKTQQHQIEFEDAIQTTGIHRLESVKMENYNENLHDVEVTGCDPGCNKPLARATIKLSEWNPNIPPPEAAAKFISNSGYYTSEELLRATRRTKFKELEDQRTAHVQQYRQAKEALSGTIRKTFNLTEMETYARTRVTVEAALISELLDAHRSYQRRIRFRHIQRNIANIVHKVFGEPSRKKRHWLKKYGTGKYESPRRCILFGRALFSGTRGCVTIPRKALIRAFGCRSLVLLTNEYNTSKLCPFDYDKLQDIENNEDSESDEDNENITSKDRLRQCPTAHNGEVFVCDRDIVGGTNIGQKGLYEMCNRRIVAFYPSEDNDN
jgi:hypothetical protein